MFQMCLGIHRSCWRPCGVSATDAGVVVGDEASALKVADPSQSSLMLAAPANSAPTASPKIGLPETANGVVKGSLNAVDAEGNPLTYAVQSQSAGSDVKVDGAGNFTYTPSVVQRLQAATTSGLDTDTFTVRVSDAQTFTDVPVTVVVRPGQLVAGTPVGVGTHPSGIAVNADGSRAYVTNQDGKSLSVINTSTGAVLSTISLPSDPKAVVLSPVAGQNRAYVAMTSGIAVIDTATDKVVDLNTTTTTVDLIKVGRGRRRWRSIPLGRGCMSAMEVAARCRWST
jgi:YVTN family beta-propeller protein